MGLDFVQNIFTNYSTIHVFVSISDLTNTNYEKAHNNKTFVKDIQSIFKTVGFKDKRNFKSESHEG